jgi:peptidoglycan endopeptidase LytE
MGRVVISKELSRLIVSFILFQRDFFTRQRRVFNNKQLITRNKINYLRLKDLLEIIEYDITRSNKSSMSATDGSEFVVIPIQGSVARKEGTSLQIDPIFTINNQLFISLRSIDRLFDVDCVLNKKAKRVCIRQPGRYFVTMKGDTLRLLARLLNTTVARILSVNKGLKDPIPLGTKVKIPILDFDVGPRIAAEKKVKIKKHVELAPAIISFGRRFLGTPYRFGAAPYPRSRRFDCSSYTQYIFRRNGVRLPRTSRSQARVGRAIRQGDVERGDLVFFRRDRYSDNRIGHVGVDIGNGRMLNTYRSPPGVTVTRWRNPFWLRRYVTAREIL